MSRSRRGSALVLGGAVLLTALVFGSRPLGIVGIGLLLAGGAARLWAGLVQGPVAVVQTVEPSFASEGDEVKLRIAAVRSSRLPVGSLAVRGVIGRLGPYECLLRSRGQAADAEISLGRVPRGRFPVSDTALEVVDPLGLESFSVPLAPPTAVVVYPRLVQLQTLFSDAGRTRGDGRRHLLRRPAGFEFHSVRDYEQGESLRRVHWPTTARRGQLMVKELEDAPRDAVMVVLDCDPAGSAGSQSDSSFDAAARAAGSVLRAYAARGTRAVLMTTGAQPAVVAVRSLADEFHGVLGALAAAEPDAPHPLERALGDLRTRAVGAGELVVVTAGLEPAAVDRLLAIAARRLVSVVWIDAPSFAGRPTRTHAGLLRLSTNGLRVAAVRRGADLAAALELPPEQAREHA